MMENNQFNDFWNKYPKRIGKLAARKAYERSLKMGATHQQIEEAVERYRLWLTAHNKAEEYIKHPATWLNAGCWEDDLSSAGDKKINESVKINLPQNILAKLKRTPIPDSDLQLWFAKCTYDPDVKRIYAPTRYMADEMERRFSSWVSAALPGYKIQHMEAA